MDTILTYKHTNVTQTKSKICRKLFGYQDKSNNGKYIYDRSGSLSQFTYKRLANGALLINNKDLHEITSRMKKEGLEIEVTLLH